MPAVSVIIPTYNTAHLISDAIDSVLAQTYRDLEIIVVDDGSTDNTAEVLADYQDRISYIYQENQERSAARNNGIGRAQGEYVAFLDADDYWAPDKLTKQIALLAQRPDLGLVYSQAQTFYGDRKWPRILGTDFSKIEELNVFEGLLLGKSIPTLTVVVRTECLQTVGLFDERIIIGEDWDLWLRITLKYAVGYIPQILAYYRLMGTYLPAQMARHKAQETRVYTVRKILALMHQDPNICLSSGLEDIALSRAWWYGCLIDYATKDIHAAQERWMKAIEHNPIFFFEQTDDWLESLIGFALHLYDTVTPQAEAEEFVAHVFDHLPEAAKSLQQFRRRAMGKLKAGYAFQAQEQGELKLARGLMRRAVAYYPPLIRNLGVVSICLWDTWVDRM
jgi:hypothetical protein